MGIFVVITGILISVSTGLCDQFLKKSGPVAFVPEATQEFKPVPTGVHVTAEFAIQNKGDAPLLIEKVKTG